MKEKKNHDWSEKREEIIKSLLGWIIPVLGIVIILTIASAIYPKLMAAWKSVVNSSTFHLATPPKIEKPPGKNLSIGRTFREIWAGDEKFEIVRPDESVGLLLRLDGRKLVLFPSKSSGEVYDLATNMLPGISYTTSVEARIFDADYTNTSVRITVIPCDD